MTNEGQEAILKMESITAGYDDRTVLHDISFELYEADFVGFIGPNGSGKTTLLRALSGSLPVKSGRVVLGGRPLASLRRRELSRKLAVVPQVLTVPVAFTVEEFVAMGRTPYVKGWGKLARQDLDAIERALRLTGTLELSARSVDELSGGERQRVYVAMALAQEPQILMLDEPTAHQDIHFAWTLMELLHTLNREQKMTVVFTTHDLNLAMAFCTKVVLLEKGRMALHGDPSEVADPGILSRVYEYPLEVVRAADRPEVWIAPRRK